MKDEKDRWRAEYIDEIIGIHVKLAFDVSNSRRASFYARPYEIAQIFAKPIKAIGI